MAIEVAATSAPAPSGGGGRGRDPLGTLIVVGGLGAGAFFGYRWWQREQAKAALLAEAERLKAQGMSTKDALLNAAAGACTAAATAYKIPGAGPMCQGAAIVALKAAELTAKGAIIAGKAIGKGTVAATKAVGKATIATGKAIGAGTKAVVYTAPKKVIGGTVNTADRLLTKAVTMAIPKPVARVISKVVPKPVKKVAAVTKKVVKKALCLGIFCGLDGIDVYEQALANAAPRANPLTHRVATRPPVANPFRAHGRALAVAPAGRSRRRRTRTAPARGAAYYASLLS